MAMSFLLLYAAADVDEEPVDDDDDEVEGEVEGEVDEVDDGDLARFEDERPVLLYGVGWSPQVADRVLPSPPRAVILVPIPVLVAVITCLLLGGGGGIVPSPCVHSSLWICQLLWTSRYMDMNER